MNSRIITYPSTVEPESNPTVVVIDADSHDVETLGLFLKTSQKDYDVYLYKGDLHDLEWLNYVCTDASHVLIKEDSQVSIINLDSQSKFGPNQNLSAPIGYFESLEPLTD